MPLSFKVGASLHKAVRRKIRRTHKISSSICMLYILECSQKLETTPDFSNKVDLIQRIDYKGNGRAEKSKRTQRGNLKRNKSRHQLLLLEMKGQQKCYQIPGVGLPCWVHGRDVVNRGHANLSGSWRWREILWLLPFSCPPFF